MPELRYKYKAWSESKHKWIEWSGVFDCRKYAVMWYNKHGSFHEQRGWRLKLFKVIRSSRTLNKKEVNMK